MKCPNCAGSTHVIDSRPHQDGRLRRRRECENNRCGQRFTTYEVVDTDLGFPEQVADAVIRRLGSALGVRE